MPGAHCLCAAVLRHRHGNPFCCCQVGAVAAEPEIDLLDARIEMLEPRLQVLAPAGRSASALSDDVLSGILHLQRVIMAVFYCVCFTLVASQILEARAARVPPHEAPLEALEGRMAAQESLLAGMAARDRLAALEDRLAAGLSLLEEGRPARRGVPAGQQEESSSRKARQQQNSSEAKPVAKKEVRCVLRLGAAAAAAAAALMHVLLSEGAGGEKRQEGAQGGQG